MEVRQELAWGVLMQTNEQDLKSRQKRNDLLEAKLTELVGDRVFQVNDGPAT